MNLYNELQQEIELLHLTDKLTIARFLYIRTGEIFEYNEAFYTYHDGRKKQKKIFYEEIDIYEVKEFRAVCASWAHLFVKLLNAFNITAEYVDDAVYWHGYVKFYINNKVYIADITRNFQDIVNIKFGLKTSHFYRNDFLIRLVKKLHLSFFENLEFDFLEMDKTINYYKGIYTDEVFIMIKKEIYSFPYTDNLQLIERVLEIVMLIINIERPNIPFFSGSSFINRMLKYFLGDLEDYIRHSNVYDKERTEFMEVIANTYGDNIQFYLYEKNEEGYFKLRKVSKKKIRQIADSYKCEHKKVLKLAK